jgi:two-component system cell cycle sensor histidine kinase PleC
VQACNNDGVWNEEGDGVSFELLPHRWQTSWARVLALALAGIAVVGVVRGRTRSLERSRALLEAMVAERTEELDRKNAELAEKIARLQTSEQAALASEERAREANRAKSVFLSRMSHELRTPLNSIIGFSQILQEMLFDQIPPRLSRFLANIHGSGEHLLALINNLLDLSKIEAGKMELALEPVNLAPLLEGVREIARGVADVKGVEIETSIEPGLPSILADQQIL